MQYSHPPKEEILQVWIPTAWSSKSHPPKEEILQVWIPTAEHTIGPTAAMQ